MMKISLWSAFFVEDAIETALSKLVSCGYRYTELSVEHSVALVKRPGKTGVKAAAVRRYAHDLGISIPQAHLDYSCDPIAVDEKRRAFALDTLKREIELYAELGVRAAILHVGGNAAREAGWSEDKIDEVRSASLQTLCEAAAGSDMRLALENLRTGVADVRELLRVIKRSGCPDGLGICLDTGHLNLTQESDQAKFVREAGEMLIALHIADNRGAKDDHLFPFGGNIQWFPLLAALRDSGYQGLFNLEVPGERIHEPTFPAKNDILMHKARYGCELARLMLDID